MNGDVMYDGDAHGKEQLPDEEHGVSDNNLPQTNNITSDKKHIPLHTRHYPIATQVESTNVTLERFHRKKWKEIHQLVKVLAEPCFHAVRIAGDDRALYENFFRAFPHDLVAKPRFESVLRNIVCETNNNNIRNGEANRTKNGFPKNKVVADLIRHVQKMQYCFELSDNNVPMLHWRLFLSAIRMLQEPLLTLREHIMWTFAVFASNGYLEFKDTDTINVSDVVLILTHSLRTQAASNFVVQRFQEAQGMIPTDWLKKNAAARISCRQLKLLLRQSPLESLFERVTRYTSYLDELTSPIYRDFVYKARKREHSIRTIERMRYLNATKMVRRCCNAWSNYVRIRRQTRSLMKNACEKLARVKKAWGFLRLKQHALVSIAAIEIQRMVRGFFGRCRAEQQWQLIQATIRVQGAFRMRSHFVKFMRDLKRRNLYAIRIQRVYRGRVGRIITRKRLLEYYYQEMAKIQKERDEFREFVCNEMAKRIQRVFKAHVRDKLEQHKLKEAFLKRQMEHEMEENALDGVRKARRYRQEVTLAYDKLREAQEQKKRRQQIDALEKQKVIRLRRHREWDAFKATKEAQKEELKHQASDVYDRMKQEWEAKIAERTLKRQKLLSHVLMLEEAGEWKQLQHQLKQLVKERFKSLSSKYKASGASVPKKDIEERAQQEILAEEVEKERMKAEEDWLAAEAEFLHQLNDAEDERMAQESAQERARRQQSALRIQCAFRMFAARKLLRQEIRGLFTKDFDPKRQVPIYRNMFTGVTTLRKPFGLGTEDLEYPDQWFLIEDTTIGELFYYNPKRMVQSWEKPEECKLCDVCTAQNFASCWDAQQNLYVCRSCYDQMAHEMQQDFPMNHYFPYDGSRQNGYEEFTIHTSVFNKAM